MSHHTGFGGPFNDLPTGLWTSAHWVWDRRAAAKKLGFPFSEESVTETILLDLAATLGHIIKIVPFTKPEEGKIGADWEWCLYDNENGRYLRFLMQAKVLDNQDTQYATLTDISATAACSRSLVLRRSQASVVFLRSTPSTII